MNVVFHYYVVRFLCERAGMEALEAERVARASQYVDESIHDLEIVSRGTTHRGIVTQDYVFWDERIASDVYLPFHFLPGDPNAAALLRRDGAKNAFVVTPNSETVKELLVAALRTDDPFRIGIALHSFADSWAHQNFSGRMDAANALDASSILPPVGHLPALTSPDEHAAVWTDGRLVPEAARVDNRARCLEAAKLIYRYLKTRRRESFDDEDFALGDLAGILDSAADKSAVVDSFVVDAGVAPYERGLWLSEAGIVDPDRTDTRFAGYDKVLWLKAQAQRRLGLRDGVRRLESDGRYEDSDLRRWHDAARDHAAAAKAVLRNAV